MANRGTIPTDRGGNVTFGDSGSPGIGPETYPEGHDYLSELIKNSRTYKEAYQIFSSDTRYGVPFLRQLEMVPHNFSARDPNFWDNASEWLGGTSDYDNLINDAFNQAMDQISILVQNYYTYINGLPREQVEQLAEAGINASVTGEGVDPSSMSSDPVASAAGSNPLNTQYNNQSLSQGITSFVEFINSMSALSQGIISSKSVMAMLDLAEREGYNKQEVHDLFMSQHGVDFSSPYRVLNSSNAPVTSDSAKVARAKARADVSAIDGEYEVNMGSDPDHNYTFEIKTGQDVLNEISRYKLVTSLGNAYINNIRTGVQQTYAETLATLEGEYSVSNYKAQTNQADFNRDFFGNRNGVKEGKSQTSIVENLMSIREAERKIKQFDAWISEYKMNTLDAWSNSIKDSPSLAPFFYKAMFDFDMSDTFYHMSPWTMGLKYGMENVEGFTEIIGNIMGFAKPKMPRNSSTHTVQSSPKGVTETISNTIYE